MEVVNLNMIFNMSQEEVNEKYDEISTKPYFKGGDCDTRLVVLLDHYLVNKELYTSLEIDIISSIVSLRQTTYVTFTSIYPILLESKTRNSHDERNNNIQNIDNVFSNNYYNENNFCEQDSFYPDHRNYFSRETLSPNGDENSSGSYKIELSFGDDAAK